MRKLLPLFIFLLSVSCYSQKVTVRGKIYTVKEKNIDPRWNINWDEEDEIKTEIEWGKISVKNTNIQKGNNPDGSYSIDVHYGDTLVFSSDFPGEYQEKELPVTDSICDVILRQACHAGFPLAYGLSWEPMFWLSLKGIVVDENSKPIPHVIVRHKTWSQSSQLYHEYETDKYGRFVILVQTNDKLNFKKESYSNTTVRINDYIKDYQNNREPYNINIKIGDKEETYSLYLDKQDADKNRDLIISMVPYKEKKVNENKGTHPTAEDMKKKLSL
jgi:hypothetical protein